MVPSDDFQFSENWFFIVKNYIPFKIWIVFHDMLIQQPVYCFFMLASNMKKTQIKKNLPGRIHYVNCLVATLRPGLKANAIYHSRCLKSLFSKFTDWIWSVIISIVSSLIGGHFKINYLVWETVHLKLEGLNLLKSANNIFFELEMWINQRSKSVLWKRRKGMHSKKSSVS